MRFTKTINQLKIQNAVMFSHITVLSEIERRIWINEMSKDWAYFHLIWNKLG